MDSYQAIYDAVRSRISGGDIGAAIREYMTTNWDISFTVQQVRDEFVSAAFEQQRPCFLMRPTLSVDGNKWCAMYGENLQAGIAGFGNSPADAFMDFDRAYYAAIQQEGQR